MYMTSCSIWLYCNVLSVADNSNCGQLELTAYTTSDWFVTAVVKENIKLE